MAKQRSIEDIAGIEILQELAQGSLADPATQLIAKLDEYIGFLGGHIANYEAAMQNRGQGVKSEVITEGVRLREEIAELRRVL